MKPSDKVPAPVQGLVVASAREPSDELGALSLRVLCRLAAAAVLLAAVMSLTACGGGGGAQPAPPPPAPSPSPSPSALIAAQLTVPTPVGYDADRLAAFNRLNEIRLSAGLGMLAQNVSMDQAAQAHAQWMVANDSFTHEEGAGTTGFTGADWWNREESLGYVPIGGDEVIAAPVRGASGVDALVNAVYHRSGMLAFEPVDIGIGWTSAASTNVSMPLVIDITRPGTDTVRGLGQAAQPSIGGVSIWPIDGAQGVPLRMGLESPNPVPTQDVMSLGTPASVMVDETSEISVQAFTLTNGATGALVPTKLLTQQDDPNGVVAKSFVALIPLVPLVPDTVYTVHFFGSSLEFGAVASTAIQKTWSFVTGGS